jgi:hypothetical protein
MGSNDITLIYLFIKLISSFVFPLACATLVVYPRIATLVVYPHGNNYSIATVDLQPALD